MNFSIKKRSRESLRDLTRKQYREWKLARAQQLEAARQHSFDYNELIDAADDERSKFVDLAVRLISTRKK